MSIPPLSVFLLGVALRARPCGEMRVRSRLVRKTALDFYIILPATRISPHQPKIHRVIGDASFRKLCRFSGDVVSELAGS